MVPSTQEALKVLRAESEPPAGLKPLAQQFTRSLQGAERVALVAQTPSPQEQVLLDALAIRLRVAAAILIKSEWTGQVDMALVDALFADVDKGIADVTAQLANVDPQLQESFVSARNDLARDAVALSEALQNTPVGTEDGKEPAKYAGRVQAKVTKIFQVDEKVEKALKQKARLSAALLAVSMLIGIGYHGYRFYEKEQLRLKNATTLDLPTGMSGTTSPSNGMSLLQSEKGKKMSPAEVQKLRESLDKEGKILVEVGSGRFLVMSKPNGSR